MMTRQKWAVAVLGLAAASAVVFIVAATFGVMFWTNTTVFDGFFLGCLTAVLAFQSAGLVAAAVVDA
jgi:hypothetical protein